MTFTAKVTARSGSPSGTVRFLDGSTVIGSVSLSSGSAALTTSSLSADTQSITANYLGRSNYRASTSPVLSQVVKIAATSTSTTLSSSANPSRAGQAVTLTATIKAATGGTATGSVQFFDGSVSLGTVT